MIERTETILPLELLFRALERHAGALAISPLRSSLLEVRRESRKRGADARIAITDQMAKELRTGSDLSQSPVYLLVGIPRDVAIEIEADRAATHRRREAGIITPDEYRNGVS